MKDGYYAFDLDGTLALFDRWRGAGHIGQPVPAMLARAKELLAAGREIRVITSRMSPEHSYEERAAFLKTWRLWCEWHFGAQIVAQCHKCVRMIALYDDRAIAVERNTGKLLSPDVR